MTATPDLSGLRANVFTGTLSPFARNPLETMTRAAEEQGPIATLRFGNANAMLVSDPAMIEELLVGRRVDFIKAGPARDQRRLLGSGLLINEGESWARQRSLAQPVFHPGNIAAYVPLIVARTRQMLESWHGKDTCNVSEEMQALLMGIAAESIFGAEVAPRAAEIGASLGSAMDHYSSRRGTARFIPDWLPLGDSRKYLNGVRDLLSLVERTIVRRKT
ncbi:MAG: cytochrome P450, partial [Gemmatimonas sp.]